MATGRGGAAVSGPWPLLERLGYPKTDVDSSHVELAAKDQRINATQLEAIRMQVIHLASQRLSQAIKEEAR